MPNFFYTAKSLDTGEEKSGTLEASRKAELAHTLREEGFLLTSARLLGQKKEQKLNWQIWRNPFQQVSLVEKMLFARHLSVMIKAGLSLSQGLETISRQTKNRWFIQAIESVNNDIQRGQPFSDSLEKYPRIFSELFTNMIRAGETGGNLDEVLKILATQMEKDHEIISRVKNALAYPAVIVIAMVGIGFLMMTMVVPKLTSVFTELNIELPATTKFIIAISNFLARYTVFGIVSLVILFLIILQSLKTKAGRYALDWLSLRTIGLNIIIQKVNAARFARTLHSLLEGGMPIVKSLQIVSKILVNLPYRYSLEEISKEIQKGNPLSALLRGYPALYQPLIIQMIEVGEKTGTLSAVLEELADFFEEEVDNLTKNLTTIIEPILMVIIGSAVGFFAISMIQPIYSMVSEF